MRVGRFEISRLAFGVITAIWLAAFVAAMGAWMIYDLKAHRPIPVPPEQWRQPAEPEAQSYLPLDADGYPTVDWTGNWAQHNWVCTFVNTGFRFKLGPQGSTQAWSSRYENYAEDIDAIDGGTMQIIQFSPKYETRKVHDTYGTVVGSRTAYYVLVKARVSGGKSVAAEHQRGLLRSFRLEVSNLLNKNSAFGKQEPAIYAELKMPQYPTTATCHTVPP